MANKQTTNEYHDMRQHIEALRKAGLLIEIDREINKDTEMHPLVRAKSTRRQAARNDPLRRRALQRTT